MKYNCIFCDDNIEILQGEHFFCPNCNSYYHFMIETPSFYEFNAYPEKNLKKYHQNQRIRIWKNV